MSDMKMEVIIRSVFFTLIFGLPVLPALDVGGAPFSVGFNVTYLGFLGFAYTWMGFLLFIISQGGARFFRCLLFGTAAIFFSRLRNHL